MRRLTLAHLALVAPPLDMIDAAQAGGFDSVGIRICPRRPGDEYFVDLPGRTAELRAIRAAAAARGVFLSNVSAFQFYPEVGWDRLKPVVEATAELGSPVIVANCFDPERRRFIDRLGHYVTHAESFGITIALEFMPYSCVRSVADALSVLNTIGRDNLGILPDALHLERSGGTPADLAAVDGSRFVFAQVCDAKRLSKPPSNAELMQEARTARLPLGAGNLPLAGFLNALPAGIELEYEVADARAERPPLAAIARAARTDLDAFLRSTEKTNHLG